MSWFTDIRAILQEEPEVWLAYLHGRQLRNLPHLTRTPPRLHGMVRRLLWFFYGVLKGLTWRASPQVPTQKIDVLVYAKSINQMHSLNATIDELRNKQIGVLAIADPELMRHPEHRGRYVPCRLGWWVELKALLVLIVRFRSLYRDLKKEHPAALEWYIDIFCRVYGYLVYFHWLLRKTKPQFVMTANDHIVPNRCMMAVAHHLGIKTVYLQHASVSSYFPALRVNYAFLDGECALKAYEACESNQPPWLRMVPMPTVFLSGQKKQLQRQMVPVKSEVGLAINALDDAAVVIDLVQAIARHGITICLRWHPGQKEKYTAQYVDILSNVPGVRLSNPKQEDVAKFLSGVNCLVAGNSSIHLEASLLDVPCIYFEITPSDKPDYYGYVRNGLAKQVFTLDEL
ncbi:MAG TPA: hypothetical protein VM553_07585, partial [Dongiaceae bacterium]|nr:hypothetical protein [Dongiaceae bacterium]